jgi:hypothetical protein
MKVYDLSIAGEEAGFFFSILHFNYFSHQNFSSQKAFASNRRKTFPHFEINGRDN